MKVDIHEATPIEYARISELTQRTNRMTNGIRYTVEELKANLIKPEFKLYSVRVSDRFSDLGIVGAIAIEGDELQLFSLSCRALGRNIEMTMLAEIKKSTNSQDIGLVIRIKMVILEAFLENMSYLWLTQEEHKEIRIK